MFDLVKTVGAVLIPALECVPTELTGAGFDTVWMEVGILVEWDGVCSVGGAENMATMSAVVAAKEYAEGGAAGGRVARGGG